MAACSAAPDEAETASDLALVTPNQELLVLPPLVARSVAPEEKDGEHLYAETTTVAVTPQTGGIWDSPAPGVHRWRFAVERAGSFSINLGFTRYRLPRGATLRLLDEGGAPIATFTDEDDKAHGELWTPIVPGIRARVELTVPSGSETHLELELTKVNSAFRPFAAPTPSGPCERDVVCPEGNAWKNEAGAVAVISLGGNRLCSGTLLNDTAGDGKPYFLTAYHCGIRAANAASLVVYWNYQTSSCGARPDGTLTHFQTGSVFRAGRAASDFTLVELDDVPKPAYEVYASGWDARRVVPPSAVCIHHPAANEKRISIENDPLSTTTYLAEESPGDGTHLRITDWDVGATEPGSSGSGLWNPEHRLVGQLHGGYAACGNDRSDWFGWLATSFAAGASPNERAKDWLDSNGTGALFVDGRTQCARPTIAFTTAQNPAPVGTPLATHATVSGGVPPYTYAWDMDGDGHPDCTTSDCSFRYAHEYEGNIELSVTDSTGCGAVLRHQQAASDANLCSASFDAHDVPKAIPDNAVAGVLSTIQIGDAGTVNDARISLRIEHRYISDLRVTLVSPTGAEVAIRENTDGTNPLVITNMLLPSLNGQPLAGTWTLKTADTVPRDTGTLVSWKLAVHEPCPH